MKAGHPSARSESTRRTFLGAGVASAVLAAGGPAGAQQPAPAHQAPRVKGPAVWLDMDQAELDAAYDQSKYASNLRQIVTRYATNSEAVRARLGTPRRHAYGPTPIEALDIYMTKRADAPINIFIHGGAWRGGLAKDFACAERWLGYIATHGALGATRTASMFLATPRAAILPALSWSLTGAKTSTSLQTP